MFASTNEISYVHNSDGNGSVTRGSSHDSIAAPRSETSDSGQVATHIDSIGADTGCIIAEFFSSLADTETAVEEKTSELERPTETVAEGKETSDPQLRSSHGANVSRQTRSFQYMHASMRACIYVHTCACMIACMYVMHVCIYMYMCTHLCMQVFMRVCMHACMLYVCLYVMCVCVCA